jgi:hypothetical protein
VVTLDGGAAATVRRAVAGDRSDGFADAAATIDGSPGGTEVESGPALDIAWNLAAGPARSAVLEAQYRVLGVVEIEGMRGTLTWPVFPNQRTGDIGAATISVTLPPGTRVLRPPGLDSPGWDWTSTDGALVGRTSGVAPADPAVLSLELALDAVPMLESHWQRRALLGRELTPAFIAAAMFIIVTAAGILFAIRFQYFRKPVAADAARRPEIANGLRTTGIVVIVFGLGAAALAYLTLRSLGPWTQAVPAGIVLAGCWFALAGLWYSRRLSR